MFNKKGVEVLLLSDPVDLLLEPDLPEFNGIALQSVSRGEVDLSKLEDEQEKEEKQKAEGERKTCRTLQAGFEREGEGCPYHDAPHDFAGLSGHG